jgi:glycosyltransferase involved in cell wall biosynthesis
MSHVREITSPGDTSAQTEHRPRVLMLTQMVVHPADAGPKVKTLQVLKHLAGQFDIVYCSFARTPEEHQHADALRRYCQRIVTVQLSRSRISDVRYLATSLTTGDSFLLRRDYRAEMHAVVKRLLDEERIDAIHVDQLNMMQFVPADWHGPIILDEHNAVWLRIERLRRHANSPVLRWLLGREARIVCAAEVLACRRAHITLAVSAEDRGVLESIAGPSATIAVAPIAINVEQYASLRSARSPQPNRVLTIGTMYSPPNAEGVVWWLREGYEKLRAYSPDVRYDVVGSRPPARLRALAAQHRGVRLHGYVADPAPFWTKAAVLAAPLLSGGGVRVKILEAMAIGVPVVSTSIGCEGIAARDGEHLLVADTPDAFARACARVLSDAALARRLADSAHRLVLGKYDATVALTALDTAYASVLG